MNAHGFIMPQPGKLSKFHSRLWRADRQEGLLWGWQRHLTCIYLPDIACHCACLLVFRLRVRVALGASKAIKPAGLGAPHVDWVSALLSPSGLCGLL